MIKDKLQGSVVTPPSMLESLTITVETAMKEFSSGGFRGVRGVRPHPLGVLQKNSGSTNLDSLVIVKRFVAWPVSFPDLLISTRTLICSLLCISTHSSRLKRSSLRLNSIFCNRSGKAGLILAVWRIV